MFTTWSYATDAEGRLVAPAAQLRDAAQLTFSASTAFLTAPPARAELHWEMYLRTIPPIVAAGTDGWTITMYDAGRTGTIGIAVGTCGSLEDEAAQVRSRTRPFHRRLNFLLEDHVVPLTRQRWASPIGSGRLPTLATLCELIHDRPGIRSRLDEPSRMAHLAHELNESTVRAATFKSSVRRSATDILTAMRLCGYDHRYGRPIPGDEIADEGEVVAAVTAALAANPYAKDHQPSRDQIVELARRAYLDVEPWPFAALTVP